jgi:uncharacterized protein (UPF0276 family)/uncharacterized low-complexity protein
MKQKHVGLAVGAAVAVGLSGLAQAGNPFTAVEVMPLHVAEAGEAQCGEAKCGANKAKARKAAGAAEAKCGANKAAQPAEAKCGAAKAAGAKPAEATCGAAKPAQPAEAKCGAKKSPAMAAQPLHGAGLGLRRSLGDALAGADRSAVDFLEFAPENWMGLGGRYRRALDGLGERWPFVCHGLALSLGGPDPLDHAFLATLRRFLDDHRVALYSEHLSYCTDGGHLYDLMPLPFTGEAVRHVAARIRETQERLGRRIAVENVSYYAVPAGDMGEAEFINAVLAEADCDLLLDVNNAYVNGANHGYDPLAFIAALPAGRVAYLHVAGHYREEEIIIDTHGAAVVEPVWALLDATYALLGPRPTLLERDFDLPPLPVLLDEVATIRRIQQGRTSRERIAV